MDNWNTKSTKFVSCKKINLLNMSMATSGTYNNFFEIMEFNIVI